VYRYNVGERFEAHYDDSVCVGQGVTGFTLLVYLTGVESGEGVKGGETVFYKRARVREEEAVIVEPMVGLGLVHLHGDKCLLHEGREVKRGVKWVLRSDVVFGQQ
jgi:hypothetical protein